MASVTLNDYLFPFSGYFLIFIYSQASSCVCVCVLFHCTCIYICFKACLLLLQIYECMLKV